MSYPRWSTSLVVNKQFWSDQSAVDQSDKIRLYGVELLLDISEKNDYMFLYENYYLFYYIIDISVDFEPHFYK
jgi:hypothetical protein